MLETSKDFFYIILAFSILWLTIFVSWILYYLIKIFREADKMVKNAMNTIEKVDNFVDTFKEKILHSSSNLMLLVELIKQGAKLLDRGEKKVKSRKTKK